MDLKTLQLNPPWDWPEDAGAICLGILRDKAAELSDRMLAAEFAGNPAAVNDELVETLLAVAGDAGEPDQLRGIAAISLGPVLDEMDADAFDDDFDPAPISVPVFQKIKETLRQLFEDKTAPKDVRRRILEASVRANADWHIEAIREAYASGDRDWMLTGVFCMRWEAGFDEQIMDALKSSDEEIRYEAVQAAGNNELDEAWPHVLALVKKPNTEKYLLLAAIEAVSSIRPVEALSVLSKLTTAKDQDVVDAAEEAIAMAAAAVEAAENDDGDDETVIKKWVN